VDAIFSAPLAWFSSPVDELTAEYSFEDLPWVNERCYRLNTLRHPSFASKVHGMTFDVLRIVATLAFEVEDDRYRAADQLSFLELVEEVLAWENGTKPRWIRPRAPAS
jgi:hypothetical protein